MYKYILILIGVVSLFTSCFKEDEKVLPHEEGEVTTTTIPMTQYYSYQIYFKLLNNEVVSSNNRSDFDLNFECADTSTVIRLNTANFAMIAETAFEKLQDVTDTIGLTWRYDKSNGDSDSLAINNWVLINESDTTFSNKVWVINRGLNSSGIQLGLKKIQFINYMDNRYYFVYSNMDNSDLVDTYVEKNDLFGYSQFLLSDAGELIQTEPENTNWDLNFTQYTTLLFTDEGLSYPYLVTGVLQSPNCLVALDSSLVFNEISLSDTSLFEFSTAQDKIGYDWKEIVGDVQTGDFYYKTKTNNTYIIKDSEYFYYKLRFINFYDPESGEKGYPTFEFQKL